ncbi:hypothetical protein KCP75_03085 [Salmonella enterica subsp. enterica]|nr:hypothetical protein KCP75_03085 [Salmonella enterica subsp. enterica]
MVKLTSVWLTAANSCRLPCRQRPTIALVARCCRSDSTVENLLEDPARQFP